MKAYRLVKANAGSAGVDKESLEAFEKNLKGNLYKVWNRMSSGSYFPPAVRAVPHSRERVLASDQRRVRLCYLSLAANVIPSGHGLQQLTCRPILPPRMQSFWPNARPGLRPSIEFEAHTLY